ncbi:MAG: FAD binding domain-containing protein [Elusimicrobiota bacterium]|nr:FAD binding domain-containing protein [Elusimicrobiota bacterium]
MGPNTVYLPKNLSEALKILNNSNEKILLLAGCTSILTNPTENASYIELDGLNLDYIKSDKNNLSVGAMTTIGQLSVWPHASKPYQGWNGLIRKCAVTIASTPNRNMITAGGNIVGLRPWSALAGVLLLLDGKIITAKGKNYPAKEFFSKLPKTILGKDIVTEIRIPLNDKDLIGEWKKFSLTDTDYPILSMGVLYKLKNKNTIENIKIVATGLTVLPQRFIKTERMLKNKQLTDNTVKLLTKSLQNEAVIGADIRVVAEYKREILGAIFLELMNSRSQVNLSDTKKKTLTGFTG